MGKPLPSDTPARASVAQLASQHEENIRELLWEKKFFLWMKQKWISKNTLMYLWAAWIPQTKRFLLSAFYLKAVALLIVVLFYTLWMTWDNLGPNEKILHCS